MRFFAGLALLVASQALASESLVSTTVRHALVSKLHSAEAVTVVRVENKPYRDHTRGIDGYEILSSPTELSSEQISELANLFAEDALFRPHNRASACGFFPGFALRVGAEGAAANVLLCFSCNEMKIVGLGEVGYESTCHARSRLLRLLRAALPEEPDLKRLDLEEQCYF